MRELSSIARKAVGSHRKALSYTMPVIATLIAFLIYSTLLYMSYGIDIGKLLNSWKDTLFTVGGWKRSLTRTLPILMPAVGLTLAFRMGFWNIGAEGQLLMGLLAGSGVAIFLAERLPQAVALLLMFIAAFSTGALWALLPAYLRGRLNVNEVLTTLMLNYVAASVFDFVVRGPWRDPSAYGFIKSPPLPEKTRLDVLIGFSLAALFAAAVYILQNYTVFGFEVRVVGSSYEVARAIGISYIKTAIKVMAMSGGLAGIGGLLISTVMTGVLMESARMTPGYGYTAIIAAWLARLNPVATVLSSFFLGFITDVGVLLETVYRVPASSIMVFEGMLLLAVVVSEPLEKKLKAL
uniref:ABC transporter permease n=1 Tax=Fervidicoccus fontis TaxID=683846 RepID=A0A7J3ZJE7_9CREN